MFSRHASVMPRLPNLIELSDSDGIMTIVLPCTFIDSYTACSTV